MSGNEAADYSRRDAALLLIGAVATAWTVLVFWQWGTEPAKSGFRSPPLIEAAMDGPLRQLPDDPGGEEVPNANRELQLAITASDPASVWRGSKVIEAGDPETVPESLPVVPGSFPTAAGDEAPGPPAVDQAERVTAVSTSDEGLLIQPLPENTSLIRPFSADGGEESEGVTNSGRAEVPSIFLRPPARRPDA